jgi:hypothetical protein
MVDTVVAAGTVADSGTGTGTGTGTGAVAAAVVGADLGVARFFAGCSNASKPHPDKRK